MNTSRPFDCWTAIGLIALHLGFLIGIIYWYYFGFYLGSWILAAIFTVFGALGITLGYHRMLTHKSFACSNIFVRRVFIFFGGLLQNAPSWIANHRAHHAYTDTYQDPHSPYWPYPGGIAGAWWSHIGWLFWKYKPPEQLLKTVDLQNADIVWENRWHLIFAAAGFILPFFIGGVIGLRESVSSFFSYGLDSFLVAGVIRTFVTLHITCSINSMGHMIGWKLHTQSSKKSSSRNNPVWALISFGEGNHATHHQHPGSARIGFWDPVWPIIKLFEKINIFREVNLPQ